MRDISMNLFNKCFELFHIVNTIALNLASLINTVSYNICIGFVFTWWTRLAVWSTMYTWTLAVKSPITWRGTCTGSCTFLSLHYVGSWTFAILPSWPLWPTTIHWNKKRIIKNKVFEDIVLIVLQLKRSSIFLKIIV